MKAQIAFEYMLVVIIALGFMIPLWAYVTTVKIEAADELSLSYAKNTVDRLASTADLIYSQGPPAKVRVSIYIPDSMVDYNITNYTINLRVRYGNVISDVFAESKAKLNGTLPLTSGSYWMEIEAVDNANYDVFMQAV